MLNDLPEKRSMVWFTVPVPNTLCEYLCSVSSDCTEQSESPCRLIYRVVLGLKMLGGSVSEARGKRFRTKQGRFFPFLYLPRSLERLFFFSCSEGKGCLIFDLVRFTSLYCALTG